MGLLGGSIRVPSAFNFLYGLRPSHGRLPYAKMANSMEGQETVHSVCGPITHSVEGKLPIPSIQAVRASFSFVVSMVIRSIDKLASSTDMRLFIKSVLFQEPWKYDSKVIPMPWRQAEEDVIKSKLSSGGLTLGFYNCDGNVCKPFLCPPTISNESRSFRTHRSSVVLRPSSLP